ncbi:uncharacterized protein JCM6883_000421 [Sporobolomyces salmoneus]|uniref:uncharacterized protein n=1 Tax=Sporobolomyces salmoneus TaxID=183962 RepID=UPI00317DE861
MKLPVPDHSRPGKASDLIKRFQQAVDSNGEAPLQVTSSFASPARPRNLSGGGSVSTSPTAMRTAQPREGGGDGDSKSQETNVPFRSAGLNEPPGDNIERESQNNALSAFPDMQPAPTQAQADALATNSDSHSFTRSRSHSPSIAIQQPSVDVPAPEVVPGSTDAIAPRSPSPVPIEMSTEDSAQSASRPLSPRPLSPAKSSSDLKGKEGLSRPTSPSADPSLLRSPPVKDDDSPPASRTISPEPEEEPASSSSPTIPPETSESVKAPHVEPSEDSPQMTSKKPLVSNEPQRSFPSSTSKKPTSTSSPSPSTSSTPRKVSTSSLKKPSSTSPTQPRTTASSTSSTTSPRPPRSLTSPTASSLAKARPRVSNPSTASSKSSTVSPTRLRSTPNNRTSPTSTRMSPSNSRTGVGAEGMQRSGSASSSSSTSALKGTSLERSGSGFTQDGSSRTDSEGKGGGSPTNVRKMATRGRIGLAGAGARIGGGRGGRTAGSNTGRSEEAESSREGQNEESEDSVKQESNSGDVAEKADDTQDLDSIPVFKGFGAGRPHGRIPIPMEKSVDPETGEEKMVAKQPMEE